MPPPTARTRPSLEKREGPLRPGEVEPPGGHPCPVLRVVALRRVERLAGCASHRRPGPSRPRAQRPSGRRGAGACPYRRLQMAGAGVEDGRRVCGRVARSGQRAADDQDAAVAQDRTACAPPGLSEATRPRSRSRHRRRSSPNDRAKGRPTPVAAAEAPGPPPGTAGPLEAGEFEGPAVAPAPAAIGLGCEESSHSHAAGAEARTIIKASRSTSRIAPTPASRERRLGRRFAGLIPPDPDWPGSATPGLIVRSHSRARRATIPPAKTAVPPITQTTAAPRTLPSVGVADTADRAQYAALDDRPED